jgi:ankyrin repeat protein
MMSQQQQFIDRNFCSHYINLCNSQGYSALTVAIKAQKIEASMILLERGANPNISDHVKSIFFFQIYVNQYEVTDFI